MPGAFCELTMAPNELYRKVEELRAAGRPLVDLTCSNFTKHGEPFPAAVLGEAVGSYLRNRSYEPDPLGCQRAREVVSTLYARRGLAIPPEQIVLTAGSSESYRLLFSLLCDPGDAILSPAITYPLFEIIAEDQRVKLEPYAMSFEGQRWQVDGKQLALSIHNTCRAILSVSPHNPTGMTITDAKHPFATTGLPIISDEVFSTFAWADYCDGYEVSPPLGLLFPDLPVFHLDGISKAYGLPDFKVSWIAMNAAAFRLLGERLALLNDSYLSGSPLTQAVMPTLLAPEVSAFQQRVRERVGNNIKLGVSQLGGTIHPQGGTQLVVPLAWGVDEDELALKLLDEGVLVHPGHFYSVDAELPGIVISCVPEAALFSEGLEIIARTIAPFGRGRNNRVHDENH